MSTIRLISIILLGIGFLTVYITMQIVPLINLIFCIGKEERKEMSINDWMFLPIFCLLMLFPMVGMIAGLPFINKDKKWHGRFTMIGIYLLIVGIVLLIISF